MNEGRKSEVKLLVIQSFMSPNPRYRAPNVSENSEHLFFLLLIMMMFPYFRPKKTINHDSISTFPVVADCFLYCSLCNNAPSSIASPPFSLSLLPRGSWSRWRSESLDDFVENCDWTEQYQLTERLCYEGFHLRYVQWNSELWWAERFSLNIKWG